MKKQRKSDIFMKHESDSRFFLRYGHHASPFGSCVIGTVEGRLAFLAFVEGTGAAAAAVATHADGRGLRPVPDEQETARLAERIFRASAPALGEIPLWLAGTAFQCCVWQALRDVPRGETVSYGDLARQIGRPRASRAVGAAVGANPIAYVVPCHRVVRADGGLGGFRWGLRFKRSLLRAEGSL